MLKLGTRPRSSFLCFEFSVQCLCSVDEGECRILYDPASPLPGQQYTGEGMSNLPLFNLWLHHLLNKASVFIEPSNGGRCEWFGSPAQNLLLYVRFKRHAVVHNLFTAFNSLNDLHHLVTSLCHSYFTHLRSVIKEL